MPRQKSRRPTRDTRQRVARSPAADQGPPRRTRSTSVSQLRRRATDRLRRLSDLLADLRAGCQEAAAQCERLQELAARESCPAALPSAPPAEADQQTAEHCLGSAREAQAGAPDWRTQIACLRTEVEQARAANACLRKGMADLLSFLDEITGLLAPVNQPSSNPFLIHRPGGTSA